MLCRCGQIITSPYNRPNAHAPGSCSAMDPTCCVAGSTHTPRCSPALRIDVLARRCAAAACSPNSPKIAPPLFPPPSTPAAPQFDATPFLPQHSLDISYSTQPFHTFSCCTQPMLSKAYAPQYVLSISANALHIQCVCCGAQTMLCNAWHTQHISLHCPWPRNKHSALRH